MDLTNTQYLSENSHGSAVTKLHAAAVNGDKNALARLIEAFPNSIDEGERFGRTPLMFCALADRVECAELLIKSGIQIDKHDKGGRTALHWAAHKSNFRMFKLLINRNASIREKDNEGQTCLHLCTRHKSPKCVSLLLRQLSPGEIDDQDNNKRTPLHWAASYGNYEHVKMLIKQDSNIGIPDSDGKTPLHWAASSRSPDAVQCVYLILKTTPSVINWQDYEGRTALHLAVADGNKEIVDVLTSISNGMISALDNMFRTPLHWAAVLGHSHIVSLLLSRNASYSSSDSNGATPLHYAAQNNHHETVEVFLSHPYVTDEPDLDGRTAFHWAASKGADEVIKVFLDHAVDIHQGDNNGATALHAAASAGNASTVKLLLAADTFIDGLDLTKHTPLLRACELGHIDVVSALLEAGARVDVVDQHSHTPLHWAALGGHAYICHLLLRNGLDPGVTDHLGRVPLHCSAFGGYINCMSVLLENSASANTQDVQGMTAFHWACSQGHLDAVKLLAEYNAHPNHMEFSEDRYTPLDYALMGEHHEVAQYMIELGALSITAIQDIAAQKIQSTFRGYRVRKTFMGTKSLLMKHEQLKKEAAKKRATFIPGKLKAESLPCSVSTSDIECNSSYVSSATQGAHQSGSCQKLEDSSYLTVSENEWSAEILGEDENPPTLNILGPTVGDLDAHFSAEIDTAKITDHHSTKYRGHDRLNLDRCTENKNTINIIDKETGNSSESTTLRKMKSDSVNHGEEIMATDWEDAVTCPAFCPIADTFGSAQIIQQAWRRYKQRRQYNYDANTSLTANTAKLSDMHFKPHSHHCSCDRNILIESPRHQEQHRILSLINNRNSTDDIPILSPNLDDFISNASKHDLLYTTTSPTPSAASLNHLTLPTKADLSRFSYNLQ